MLMRFKFLFELSNIINIILVIRLIMIFVFKVEEKTRTNEQFVLCFVLLCFYSFFLLPYGSFLNQVNNLILLKYLQITLCLIQTNLVKQSACQQIIINCSDGKQPFHRLNRDLHSIYMGQ